ncbi:HNH endonuclease signature motif containing protein [Microbacterium sp. C7(2022)]|uniref:HNH endonuclease signature motif containing protein n=1 Tax=Microbacterium sp. C7(2022) TaxID=2992759 RepID=UPI00237A40DD|nr:HNH endonuclease signature motif containing protein [Microbacterium sp. C7(2022)]MDE0545285.1 HNH endonuclease [Microbacterium sp. C7(2022)]
MTPTPADVTAADAAAAKLDPVVAKVAEIHRRIAALQAEELHALAEASQIAQEWADATPTQSDTELAHRSVAAELSSALRVSDRTVQGRLGDAERLVSSFRQTVASLHSGRISLAHARAILEAGDRITGPEMIAEFENSVLDYAEAESVSRLREVAKIRAQWFLDESIRERHAAAAKTRSARAFDLDDGMAELHATGPAVLIHGLVARLTTMGIAVRDADASALRDARAEVKAAERAAREADTEDDAERLAAVRDAARDRAKDLADARRTLDEIRFDLLADLLLTADPMAHIGDRETGLGAIRATVQVTIPALTLLDSPVDDPFDATTLAGHGPIHPDTARELAAHAPGWDRILTHPVSGRVVAVDRYRPSKKMRRFLTVRDQHCRFPGCRQPASRSDADHTIDWAHGGTTSVGNLAHLCRRHHTLKHHTPWKVTQSRDGILHWTSPTGRVYPDHPTSSVRFATDAESDPVPPRRVHAHRFAHANDPAPF